MVEKFLVDPEQLSQVQTQINSQAGQVDDALNSIIQSLGSIEGLWEGAARQGHQELMEMWQKIATEAQTALIDTNEKLGIAVEQYRTTESEQIQRFRS